MKLDTSALQSGAQALGVNLTTDQLGKFETYFHRLQEWNSKLNLTSVRAEETLTLHFLDSLTIARVAAPSGKVLDVGTGAGFPGMVLKIAFPEIRLTLLDSVAKKLTFINALSTELGLETNTLCSRAEVSAHDPLYRERFDLVVSRAVADLSRLAHWTLPFVRVGGRAIAMKSRDSGEELESAHADILKLGGSEARVVEVSIPGTTVVRHLISVHKQSPTPAELPKRGNVKTKKKNQGCAP